MGGKVRQNIFVTGGTGYIGRNLREYLKTNYTIFSPTHVELELQNVADVEKYFQTHNVDTVIHAAVVGGSRKEEEVENSLEINLRMLFNILRCRRYFRKFIHLGSGAEYDTSRPCVRIKEIDFDSRVPHDAYGFYKYLATKQSETIPGAVNLRIFGLFGQGEDYCFRFISNAICRNLYGMPITIRQNVFFDYVYIKDFIRIVEYFISHQARYPCYNIGTGKRIDLLKIAKKINTITDQPSKIVIKEDGLNLEYTCDATRLMKELNNFSFTSFDVALKELYMWYKARKTTIDPSIL